MSGTKRTVVAAIIALVFLLSACSPVMTQNRYAAGDGVRADLGDSVHLENLLIITEAEGSPGTLVGAVVNTTAEPLLVALAAGNEVFEVEVPGNDTVLLQPDNENLVIGAVMARPGGTLDVQASTVAEGSILIPVPVLDGTINPYQDYLPTEVEDDGVSTTDEEPADATEDEATGTEGEEADEG